jgi:hypothetical protein
MSSSFRIVHIIELGYRLFVVNLERNLVKSCVKLTVCTEKILFWVVALCSLVDKYQCSG